MFLSSPVGPGPRGTPYARRASRMDSPRKPMHRSAGAPSERRSRPWAEKRGDATHAKRQRPQVTYWIFNYAPKWEAASKEVRLLARSLRQRFATRIISLDQRSDKVSLFGRDKHLPLPMALLGFPFMMRSARAAGINHIFASARMPLVKHFLPSQGNTILTITKGVPDLSCMEKNAKILASLQYIVVESEFDKDLMQQLGIPEERVKLIYPGIEPQPTRIPSGPFTIMFASSPLQKLGLLSRGIHLMVEVARLLPDVHFRLVWRSGPKRVRELIAEAGVRNVELVEGFVADMKSMYDSAHATILPGLAHNSLKPAPHSGLHSLAHGKPLLVSRVTSLAGLVEEKQCGVVFEPTIPSLREAILELKRRYDHYQANALPTSRACFSRSEFIERYADLYTTLLRDAA
jgi:glycosyltransferase involved in cell wall biosynthesis